MDGDEHMDFSANGNQPTPSNGTNDQQSHQAGQIRFPPPNVPLNQQPQPSLRPPQPLIRPPQFQPQNQQQQQPVTSTELLMLQVLQQIQEQLHQQQTLFHQQNQSFLQQQGQLFRNGINVQVPPNPEVLLDSLASNLKEFEYEPDQNVTFAGWFARYKDLFEKDAVRLDDEAKVRLLLRKIRAAEYERYCNYILPKSSSEISFVDTVTKLKSLFGTSESVISKRYRCLQVTKQATEDRRISLSVSFSSAD